MASAPGQSHHKVVPEGQEGQPMRASLQSCSARVACGGETGPWKWAEARKTTAKKKKKNGTFEEKRDKDERLGLKQETCRCQKKKILTGGNQSLVFL